MDMTSALSVVDTLREGWYDPPTNYYQKSGMFEYESYKCSGMDEIRQYLIEHLNEDPIKMVEEFRHIVDDFSCRSNPAANFMFSVYYDVATDVLDVLLSMK